MPYKDITYDNGFTERVYYDETPEEEASRMSRTNRVKSFPSVNHRAAFQRSKLQDQEPPSPSREE